MKYIHQISMRLINYRIIKFFIYKPAPYIYQVYEDRGQIPVRCGLLDRQAVVPDFQSGLKKKHEPAGSFIPPGSIYGPTLYSLQELTRVQDTSFTFANDGVDADIYSDPPPFHDSNIPDPPTPTSKPSDAPCWDINAPRRTLPPSFRRRHQHHPPLLRRNGRRAATSDFYSFDVCDFA